MTSAVRKSTPTKRVNPKIHFETSSRPSSGAMNLLGWVADNPLITHVSVEAGKRTTRAAGPVRLRIIGGTADAVKITIAQYDKQQRTTAPVADYETPNVSKQVLRVVMSYTDYVNRTVWRRQ